jgi:AraC family transcriptional regulator
VSSFSGVEVEVRSAGGIRCSTSVFPPRFETAPHAHDEAYFCLVVEGSSAQRSGGAERVRERGRAYFYPAGEQQSERFGRPGGRLFSIRLGPGVISGLPEATRLPERSSELAGLGALLVRRLFGLAGDDPCAVEDLTLLLVGTLARDQGAGSAWAPLVRDYLHAHFREKPTLGQIAAAVGLHPVHLCRAFPQRFGVTIGAYLRALRVDCAARQLVATERPLADIALDAGFSSQAHLTRELKKHLGTTPAAYRRR